MKQFENGVIPGVAVITIGEARGHGLMVDKTTLEQIETLANQFANGVKVKEDHGRSVGAIIGMARNFRTDGDTLRADLHLLENVSNRKQLLEIAAEMPEEIGLSASFSGVDEDRDGVTYARAEELYSIDLVDMPAANPTGLFSRKIDNPNNNMDENQIQELTATVSELVSKQMEGYATELAGIKEMLEAMKPKELTEDEEKELEAEKEKAMQEAEEKELEKDKELAAKVIAAFEPQFKQLSAILGQTPVSPSGDTPPPVQKDFNAIVAERIAANPTAKKSLLIRECATQFQAEYIAARDNGTLKQF